MLTQPSQKVEKHLSITVIGKILEKMSNIYWLQILICIHTMENVIAIFKNCVFKDYFMIKEYVCNILLINAKLSLK